MTVREARANLEMMGVMYSEADKNLGISLIPCGELERAQTAMVKELGGDRTDLCSKDFNDTWGGSTNKICEEELEVSIYYNSTQIKYICEVQVCSCCFRIVEIQKDLQWR